MLGIYQAYQLMLTHTQKTNKVEVVPIEAANNRVLAMNVQAPFDMPRFNNSAMDGYGIKLADKGKKLKPISKTLAGDDVTAITQGQCVKIMTGAKVDDSIEAVVPIEAISREGEYIQFPHDIKPQANIRPKGEEFHQHDILLYQGEVLDSAKIALLASLGVTHVRVYQKPNILILSTGNEIKNHYEQITQTEHFNSSSLYFQLEPLANMHTLDIIPDDIHTIQQHIDTDYDLIISTGGVSKGDADFTIEAFRQKGYDIKFNLIAIKPGKPFGFGVKDGNIACLLTGNPLAAVLNYNIFVRSIIRKLAGCKEYYLDYIKLPTTNRLQRKAGRDEAIPVKLTSDGVELSTKRGSGMISVIAQNNGIVIIDKSLETIEDKVVKFIDFTRWSEEFREFISN
ncbi:MAG: molybdopterin molybdotransferase MoeA [Epsilonproteobacteria bacterium]|nr:molybdopterin molybdotransferase MoeA [Campylobacterota bacterium]